MDELARFATVKEEKRKRQLTESEEQRLDRIEPERLSRKVAQDSDDAALQAMIERSIKLLGPLNAGGTWITTSSPVS